MSGDTWFKTGLAQTKKTKLPEQFRLFKMKNNIFLRMQALVKNLEIYKLISYLRDQNYTLLVGEINRSL